MHHGRGNTAQAGEELTVVIYLSLVGLKSASSPECWAFFIISPKMTLSHRGLRVVSLVRIPLELVKSSPFVIIYIYEPLVGLRVVVVCQMLGVLHHYGLPR
jgi:hypothetical protein